MTEPVPGVETGEATLDGDLELDGIEEVCKRQGGDSEAAAAELGIMVTTLVRSRCTADEQIERRQLEQSFERNEGDVSAVDWE